jgi:hypothetical protein
VRNFGVRLSPLVDWSYVWLIAHPEISGATESELERFILERQLLPDALQPVARDFIKENQGDAVTSRRFARWRRYSFPFVVALSALRGVPLEALSLKSPNREGGKSEIQARIDHHSKELSRIKNEFGDTKIVLRDVRMLLWDCPASPNALLIRSMAEYERRRFRVALREISRCIVLAPRVPLVWTTASNIARAIGNAEAARQFEDLATACSAR